MTWKAETARYTERVNGLLVPLDKTVSMLARLPGSPAPNRPSGVALINYRLSLYIGWGVAAVHGLGKSYQLLWNNGLFVSVSGPARLALEMWGTVKYAGEILSKLDRTDDVTKAFERIDRLTFGSRSGVPSPWGDQTGVPPIHAMDYVRCLKEGQADILETYNFLCDACHPVYLQSIYLQMAGPTMDGYPSEAFWKYGHKMLDRTLASMEQSIGGVSIAACEVLERTYPVIEAAYQD